MSSASQGHESTGKAVLATQLPVVSNDTAPKPVTKLPSNDQSEDSDSDQADTGDSPKLAGGERSCN